MTCLNRPRSVVVVAAAVAGTEARTPSLDWAIARRLYRSGLAALLIIAGASGLAVSARDNGNPVGSLSVGASSGGRMISAPMRRARLGAHFSTTSSLRRFGFRREDFHSLEGRERAEMFRRFHHHGDHDRFEDGFFPFGFLDGLGWPVVPPDLALSGDEADQSAWRGPPFWVQVDRYERPTVEKTPSGVTIVRGPGSHHTYVSSAPLP
jgi:hypothetical protein